MRYKITAYVDGVEQTPYECDEKPLIPSVGDHVVLVTQDGPGHGKVTERKFTYHDDTCFIQLICEDSYAG